jgi:AcrR family transcriptional regulator
MARQYTMKRRADRLEETRRRIAEATLALHEEVGPARTTVTAIAERAGVSRPTVYSQFPNDLALFSACSAHFLAEHPTPELVEVGLEEALHNLYGFFAANERTLENIERDARLLPALGQAYARPLAVRTAAADSHAERLATGDLRVRAVLRLAFSFCTSQHLARAGLGVNEAASLMASLAQSSAAR